MINYVCVLVKGKKYIGMIIDLIFLEWKNKPLIDMWFQQVAVKSHTTCDEAFKKQVLYANNLTFWTSLLIINKFT